MIRDFPTANTPSLHAAATQYLAVDPAHRPDPVPARPASTVMLVRDGDDGVEVFMLRRVATMEFAPSTMVFPGGSVDGRDDADLPWAGPGPVQWAARLGCDDHATRMLVVAAVREVFEECGVLLASAGEHGPLVDVDSPDWRAARAALVAREVSLGELLHEKRLRLRTDLLRAEAHWVTPVSEARRFDTRFFVAIMPAHQVADGETSEADRAAWVRPQDVLQAYAAHRATLLPPTVVALEHLARSATAQQFFDEEPVIHRLLPELARADDGAVVMRVDFAGVPEPPRPHHYPHH